MSWSPWLASCMYMFVGCARFLLPLKFFLRWIFLKHVCIFDCFQFKFFFFHISSPESIGSLPLLNISVVLSSKIYLLSPDLCHGREKPVFRQSPRKPQMFAYASYFPYTTEWKELVDFFFSNCTMLYYGGGESVVDKRNTVSFLLLYCSH